MLCFALLSWLDLAPVSGSQALTSQPHPHQHPTQPWSLWTPKDVEDPENLKPTQGFTGCMVSSGRDFVDSVFSSCQRLNQSLYRRSQGVKLFGLCKCHRLSRSNTMLPLALTCTDLWMWKYFAVFLMRACILLSANSYNKTQAKPSAALETRVTHWPPNIYHLGMPERQLPLPSRCLDQ